MSPFFRVWGITALCVALLLTLRGAFALALALFVFSPAPVLLFSRGASDQGRLSLSWLGVLATVVAGLCVLFALVVYVGGVPQVHEWPAVLRGGGK
jgi:hypothetical protein